jgi:hypothetical protein
MIYNIAPTIVSDRSVELVGSEFEINKNGSTPSAIQVSSLSNGGFVVSWLTWSGDQIDRHNVEAQIFYSNGTPSGEIISVNTLLGGNQLYPEIAGLIGGGFSITWEDWTPSGSARIAARVFNADGSPIGEQFQVDANGLDPNIAALSNGNFVITWQNTSYTLGDNDGGIHAQVFGADGISVSEKFLVNTKTLNQQDTPVVAGLIDGRFVIIWKDRNGYTQNDTRFDFKAQIFDGTGNRIGDEIILATNTLSYINYQPQVAALRSGGFVVTWSDVANDLGDADGYGIKAHIFDSNGAKVGDEFLVNTITAANQSSPTITGLSDGGFFISWTDASAGLSVSSPDMFNVKAQAYNADGSKRGHEILVNTTTVGNQYDATTTGLSNGDIIVAWFNDNHIFRAQLLALGGKIVSVSTDFTSLAALSVAENSAAVTIVKASDPNAGTTLSYSISGGADAALFEINAATGALSFKTAPNFEAPADSGTNNVYDVEVQVSDGTLTDTQAIAVTVTNVDEQVIVNGTAGDDRLVSQAVNEAIAGLAGFDTVVFSGPRLEYDISRVGDTVTVTHLQAGGDGTDTLTGVERLQFADGFMGLVPEELVLFLPGTRDLITWDSTQGSNGFTYFFRLNATTNVAAVADLTGDGRADLLLSQPNGGLVRWDPSQGGNGFSVLPAAPGFDVAAIGDITGNGADDILLKNANGQLRMLDPALGTADDLFALAPGWSLKGVANINGSGKDDIILQNDASGAVIAFTDQGWRDLITLAPGSGWEIAGLGDVVGGLADDFIFRNSNTGVTIFWDTTDNTGGFHDFATIGQGWNLTKVSDLSGDGRDDVVYQNANGLAIYWSGNSWVDLGSTLIGADMMGTGLFL